MTEATDNEFKIENIEKKHFVLSDPAQAKGAQEYIGKIMGVLPANKISYNFDPPNIPTGFDILVLPVSKREGEKGNVIQGACIAAVPSIESVLSHPKGQDFIRAAVLTAYAIKLGNAVRPKDDGSAAPSVPASVEDFIENRRGGGGLEAFNTIAKDIVAVLRKRGLKLISVPILRQVLSSKSFAETQYPKLPQENWLKVLDTAIALAKSKNLDPSVMENWKTTRNQATVDEITEIDLSFDDLINSGTSTQATANAATPVQPSATQ